jgi:hypothetical protein
MSGDEMNYQRVLRVFILADIFAMVGGVIAAAIFEGTLPEPLRAYVATEELHPFLLVAGLILLILLIVAWAGLWRNASWAPPVYAVMWVSTAVIVPFFGPYVGTGIEEMFDVVGTSAGGGILALVFLAMQERRRRSLSASPGGESTLEGVEDAGRPDRPDEPLQPHLKSWRVHQALACLYGLIMLMLLALPFVAETGKELDAGQIARAFVFPLFFFALAVVHHVVSRGAKKRKRWARAGSIVLACLLLPAVPVGTLVGVYLLRNGSWEAGRDGPVGSSV